MPSCSDRFEPIWRAAIKVMPHKSGKKPIPANTLFCSAKDYAAKCTLSAGCRLPGVAGQRGCCLFGNVTGDKEKNQLQDDSTNDGGKEQSWIGTITLRPPKVPSAVKRVHRQRRAERWQWHWGRLDHGPSRNAARKLLVLLIEFLNYKSCSPTLLFTPLLPRPAISQGN